MRDLQPEQPAGDPLAGALGEVLSFMRLLWAVDHQLQSASKRMKKRLGVTGPQRTVVRVLGRMPGIPAGSSRLILHVHPSTLTGVLKRLEAGGFIVRMVDPRDGRRALFELSDLGREMDRTMSGTVEAGIRKALETLPEKKIAIAEEVLTALANSLIDQEA